MACPNFAELQLTSQSYLSGEPEPRAWKLRTKTITASRKRAQISQVGRKAPNERAALAEQIRNSEETIKRSRELIAQIDERLEGID
jgi:hypothetical protein